MSEMEGMHAFCHHGYEATEEDRFGRLFTAPPLYIPPDQLRDLGARDGPMDEEARDDPVERTDSVPVGQIFFGQFIDHDITLDTTSSLSSTADAKEVTNVRTPTLDLDNIYGLGPEAQPFLYHATGEYEGVKLLTGENGTAAKDDGLADYDLQRSPHGTAIIGDHRNDENRIISQLQLAMIRFHNAVAEHLRAEENLEGSELFEEARRLTRWHYQYVVVEDYLPTICGRAVVKEIQGRGRQHFCPSSETPYIPIEFAVAAYRFGHSMMPKTVQVQRYEDEFPLFGPTLGNGFEPLSTADAVVDWDVLADTPGENVVQQAEQLDTQMASLLLKLPFLDGENEVQSLATRNLLRGQVFLLPSGEQVARAMGRDASEINRISEAAEEVAEPEADFSSGTPLWFYILVEAERKGRETAPGHFESGEGLGPVGARIVAETLYGLIELDKRSYLSTNRNWRPEEDGVGVDTLGKMLTYGKNPVPSH